jgi:hypothetical protein
MSCEDENIQETRMPYTIIHIDPFWRCPCGAPIKAFDIDVKPDEIMLDCRPCQRRLLAIESDTASDLSEAMEDARR